jgi:hypothetical protein
MEALTQDGSEAPKKKQIRTAEQIKEDRVLIAEQYVKGRTQHEIARWLCEKYPFPLSRSLVAREIGIIQEEWHRRSTEAISRIKARQLSAIGQVERTAWERFEASCKAAERRLQEKQSAKSAPDKEGKTEALGEKQVARVTQENRDGDPRWLELVLKCVERRCKILGIDAPQTLDIDAEVNHNTVTPAPAEVIDGGRAWDIVLDEAKHELAQRADVSSLST